MDEVPGLSKPIPPLALYPATQLNVSLPSAEWESCLDSWLFSLEFRLRLSDDDFSKFKLSQDTSGVEFLLSFFRAQVDADEMATKSQKERLLFKRAYLLLRRLLLATKVPMEYGNNRLLLLLELASVTFASVADWKTTLKVAWTSNSKQLTQAIEDWKKGMMRNLTLQLEHGSFVEDLRRMNALVKVSAEIGLVIMTGSDYLETLMEAYEQAQSQNAGLLRVLTEHIFYCLRSLTADGSSHGSLLLDHLYFMKSDAEQKAMVKPTQPTLCSSLVCSTTFLRHLAADTSISSGNRGQGLLDFFTGYQQSTKHLHPPMAPRRRKIAKGKGKANPREEMHFHKASQVSQVHNLFPDMPNHYILRLLDHFNDDTEAVVAALLEPGSLPAELRDPGPEDEALVDIAGPAHDLAPRTTPPLLPQRRNVFDGDDFDKLQISSDRLHKGRKVVTVSQFETEDDHSQRKAAIISALAAFDSDDDERDDTYDVADVGGTVDSTLDTDDRRNPEPNPHEQILFRAWSDNHDFFARDTKTRISKVRQGLKRDTGMSDEQIEGWAIILKKDPNLQRRLERKYAAAQSFRGDQNVLNSTRWQGDNTPEDSEEGEGGSDGRRIGQAQIRGNRVWGRGGRGSSTGGPSGDAATQAARRRKEQGRGRGGASHGRREGRARKMGRGMAGAVQQ